MRSASAATPKRLHQRNRAAWDEAAQAYAAELAATIAFLRAGGKNFCAPEWPYLANLAAWCRRAIHLQCAGGRDTLSLWNHGAAEVIGIDISARMIAAARQAAAAIGARAQWFCCDVLAAPAALNASADLVYTGRGALCWIMDLAAWARVVARLLKPGGRLYVFEGHPLDWVWDPRAATLQIEQQPPYGDYFATQTACDKGWPETYIPAARVPPLAQQSVKYERQWTLGQIINDLLDAGLIVTRFEEHPDQFWDQAPLLPADIARRVPHTFSLLMRRPA